MGLRPFYEEDAEYFRGRDEDVEAVMNMLLVHRLTILHGVAGVGKTSFLRAGVALALKQEAKRNRECWGFPELGIVVFPKSEDPQAWLHEPLRNLKDEIGEQMRAVGVDCSSLGPDDSLRDFLKAIALRLDSQQGMGRLYLILDQFERCLHEEETDVRKGAVICSFANVINTPEVPIHTLIALHSSDIRKLERLEGLIPRLWDNRYELKHLDKEAARQAILRPIMVFNSKRRENQAEVALEQEETFAEQLLEDLREQSQDRSGSSSAWKLEAPYLQLVMQRLWQKEGIPEKSHVIHLTTYESLGRTEGIIQEHVDQTMAQLAQMERDAVARSLRVLLSFARPARVGELVDLANEAKEDWQPELRKELVQHLFEDHLALNRIFRPLAHGEYESFLHTLRKPLDDWVRRQKRLDGLPQEVDSAEAMFKRSQLDGLRQAADAALFALQEIQRHKVSASEVPTPLLIGSLKRMLNEVVESRRITDPDSPLDSMSYSPDGKWFATASFNGCVHLLNRENGTERTIQDPDGSVLDVTLGPDERVALASGHGYARILNFKGKVLKQFPKEPATYPCYSAAFSADGKRLATGSMDGVARIWDIDGDRCIAECRGHELAIHFVAFCQTQPILLTASWDGTVRLWNAGTGDWIRVYQVEGNPITHGSISWRGDRVATICWSGLAHIWNLGDKRPLREFQTYRSAVSHICFHDSEGQRVATVSWDGTARVWDVAEKPEAETVSYHFVPGPMTRACFSPDGHELATNQWDGVVHLWTLVKWPRAKGREDTTTVLQTPGIPQMFATFSPHGDQIAIAGFDKKIRLYSVRLDESGVKLDLLLEKGSFHDGPLSCVAFDPSGTGRLATASYDRTGRLWFLDGNRLDERACLEGHKAQIYEIAYSPREEVVATASGDGTVRFWDLSGKETACFQRVGLVYSAKFHPKENVVASAWGDGFIRLIDLSGKLIGEYRTPGSSSPAFCIDFSGDGRFLGAVFGNGTACAWECRGSPDTWLARELRRPPFQAHEGPAIGIAFSPSPPDYEPWLATSSMDGLVRLWSLNGRKLAEFTHHDIFVRSIDFHPNPADLRLLTAFVDGTAKLLKIDHGIESLQDLHRQARKWLGDRLAEETVADGNLPLVATS